MNKDRRKRLETKVLALLSTAREYLEEIVTEEREAVDNLPDGLRGSERGERMEEIADALEEAASSLEEIEASLEECQE